MSLIHTVIGPPTAERVLVLLHGYGADERDLGALVPYLDPEGRFHVVLPRGPVAAPPGFAWYEVSFGGPPGEPGQDAPLRPRLTEAVAEVDALLDQACKEFNAERAAAVVGGFSQGGGLALTLALARQDKPHPAAVLAMSTMVPGLDGDAIGDIEIDWDAARDIPTLVEHGTEDPMVPVEQGRALAETLIARGVPVTYHEYPMGHQVAMESLQDAHEWLLRIQAGEKPSAPLPERAPEPLVKPVTTSVWDREVLASELPVIVDFWAPWCQPCRMVSPVVEQIAAMRQGSYKVVKVNIDEEPALAQTYGVQSIPMIGLFRNGKLERAALGAKPRQQLEAELGMLVIP